MDSILDGFLMFIYYARVTIKAWFQYRIDAFLRSLAVFLREATGIIVIYFTLLKFDSVNGWNMFEMVFLFSLIFLTYGVLVIFFTGLRDFEYTILRGDFDRIMLRPRGLLFQIIAINSDWFAALGQGGLGITLFIISANRVGITWDFRTIIYYIATLIGGVLIQGALFLFFACLCFWVIKTDNIREVFFWNVRKFAGYPVSIFPRVIQWLLIYIIPFAFVNYFPAQYLLRKPDMEQYWHGFMYISPLIGVVMFILAYLFWKYSIKFYKSTGN